MFSMLLNSKVLKFRKAGIGSLKELLKKVGKILISIIYTRLPNVLVVGVKKCGTGALIHQPGIHPQMSCPKYGQEENMYFAQDLLYNRGIQSYIVSSV